MAYEIRVPPFGESITEGTIAQWLKADGDFVRRGEPVAMIDSEKASSEIEAEVSGRLRIVVAAGRDAAVGAVIGLIEETGETTEGVAEEVAPPAPTPANPAAREGPMPPPVASPAASEPTVPVTTESKESISPIRPISRINLVPDAPPATATPPALGQPRQPVTPLAADPRGERREPMTRMRRTIAERLLRARHDTAMLTSFNEVDMSAALEMRHRLGESFQQRYAVKLGLMSFFIKAAAGALRAMPVVNSSIDGNDIVHHDYVDIAVAVSTERGLVVPVIRDAGDKSFADLERELADLAVRARENRLGLDELRGGTFTVTNAGVFGSMLSTPLLNPPQVAILGMHAIEERPVAIQGRVEIRPMMYLALSYDHRLIDGRDAVLFLRQIKDRVAEPDRLVLGL